MNERESKKNCKLFAYSMSDKVILRKPRSPHEIVFSPDPSDNHFFNVVLRKVKTGAEVATHYILRSDIPSWVTMYEGDGFKTITNNEDNERK